MIVADGAWCNGNILDSDSSVPGSSPGAPANQQYKKNDSLEEPMPQESPLISQIINRRIRDLLLGTTVLGLSEESVEEVNNMIGCTDVDEQGIRGWLSKIGFTEEISQSEIDTIFMENVLLSDLLIGKDPLSDPVYLGGESQRNILEHKLNCVQQYAAFFDGVGSKTPQHILSEYDALKQLRGGLNELRGRLESYLSVYPGLEELSKDSVEVLQRRSSELLQQKNTLDEVCECVQGWFELLEQLKEVDQFITSTVNINSGALGGIETHISKAMKSTAREKIDTFNAVDRELGSLRTQALRIKTEMDSFAKKAEGYFQNLEQHSWPVADLPNQLQIALRDKNKQLQEFMDRLEFLEKRKDGLQGILCGSGLKKRVKGGKYLGLTVAFRKQQCRATVQSAQSQATISSADLKEEPVILSTLSLTEFIQRVRHLKQQPVEYLYVSFKELLGFLEIQDCTSGHCSKLHDALNQLVLIENSLIEQTVLALKSRMRELFLSVEVKPEELNEKGLSKEDFARFMRPFADYFNRLSCFVISEIVSQHLITARVRIYEHWVWVANLCKEQGDLHSAMSIYSALVNSSIDRLKYTQGYISKEAAFVFKNLATLFDRDKNYKQFRSYLATHPDVLPFMGLYAGDMTFIRDGHEENLMLTGNQQASVNMWEPLWKKQQIQTERTMKLSPVAQAIQQYFDTVSILTSAESSQHSLICEPKSVRPDDGRIIPYLVLNFLMQSSVSSQFIQDQLLNQPSAFDEIVSTALVQLIKFKLGRRLLEVDISQKMIDSINHTLCLLDPAAISHVIQHHFQIDVSVEEIKRDVLPEYSSETKEQYTMIFDWMIHHRVQQSIRAGKPNLDCLFVFGKTEIGTQYLQSDEGYPLLCLAQAISQLRPKMSHCTTRDGLLVKLLTQIFKFDEQIIKAGERLIYRQQGGDDLLVNCKPQLAESCKIFYQNRNKRWQNFADVNLFHIYMMVWGWFPSSKEEREAQSKISNCINLLGQKAEQEQNYQIKERVQSFIDLRKLLCSQLVISLLLKMMDVIRCEENSDEKLKEKTAYQECKLFVYGTLNGSGSAIDQLFGTSRQATMLKKLILEISQNIHQLEKSEGLDTVFSQIVDGHPSWWKKGKQFLTRFGFFSDRQTRKSRIRPITANKEEQLSKGLSRGEASVSRELDNEAVSDSGNVVLSPNEPKTFKSYELETKLKKIFQEDQKREQPWFDNPQWVYNAQHEVDGFSCQTTEEEPQTIEYSQERNEYIIFDFRLTDKIFELYLSELARGLGHFELNLQKLPESLKPIAQNQLENRGLTVVGTGQQSMSYRCHA
jgi:hypothetical protein